MLAVAILHGTASAHLGERVFPIYELPSSDLPDLHDGTLEDWDEVLVPSLDVSDFRGLYIDGEDGGPVDRERIAFEVYLAWHYPSQRIFVGINRFDGMYTQQLPPEPPPVQVKHEVYDGECCWQHDHVDLVIDGDHGGEACAEEWNPTADEFARASTVANRQCQRYTAVPESAGERTIRAFTIGPSWAFLPPYTDAGGFRFGESPSLSGYEIALTSWDELQEDFSGSVRSRLEAGRIVGLCIGIWDIDELKWPRYVQTGEQPKPWSLYAAGGCDPYDNTRSVDAQLVPCTEGDCSGGSPVPEPSAVTTDAWGRIKAAFTR